MKVANSLEVNGPCEPPMGPFPGWRRIAERGHLFMVLYQGSSNSTMARFRKLLR
jgi:hypothetical protein